MMLRMDCGALELTFRMLLTCGCPVTEAEERAVFNILVSSKEGAAIEYDRILSVFPPGAVSPFHAIREFYIWQAPVYEEIHLIERTHVIRFFASSFHWDHAVAPGLAEGYGQVKTISSWFLSHMLLPARVTEGDGDQISLIYEYPGGAVYLKNLFGPEPWHPVEGELWAVHFAGLLDRLSPEEHDTAVFMLEQNPALKAMRREVPEIDYLDFERKGDYAAACRERYLAYYS